MLSKKNEKLLHFDYDGTLVDPTQMIIDGTVVAFNRCGLPSPQPEKLKLVLGKN